MKKNLSPGVVILIIAVVVIIVGLIFVKKGGPGANQTKIDEAISNTVVKPGASIPGAPNATAPAAPAAPAPTK